MTQPVTQDPSDLIVGTMRLPTWIGRVPRAVWLFGALAVLDAVVRLTLFGPFGPMSVGDVASIALTLVQPVVVVALPAAVVLGRHPGSAGRALLFGSLLLMFAEIVSLAAQALDRALVVAEPAGGLDTFAVVRFVAAILALAGVAFLASGVRLSVLGNPTSTVRRVSFLLVASTVVAALVNLVVLATYVSREAPDLVVVVGPFGLVGNVVGILTEVVWGLLAACALIAWSTVRGRGLGLVATGTAVVVVSTIFGTLLSLTVFTDFAATTQAVQDLYFALFRVSTAVRALGLVLVLVGMAVGFRRSEPVTTDSVNAAETEPIPA
jgi:hypothetical protein